MHPRSSSRGCNTNNTYSSAYKKYCTHPFNGPFSRLPGWAGTRKVKTSQDFTEARDSEWQWYQLGHMQVCTSCQQPTTQFLQAGCPSCHPTNSVKALKGSIRNTACTAYIIAKSTTTPRQEWYLIRCESDGCGRCRAADSSISSWKTCNRSSGWGPSGATPSTGLRRIADVAWTPTVWLPISVLLWKCAASWEPGVLVVPSLDGLQMLLKHQQSWVIITNGDSKCGRLTAYRRTHSPSRLAWSEG